FHPVNRPIPVPVPETGNRLSSPVHQLPKRFGSNLSTSAPTNRANATKQHNPGLFQMLCSNRLPPRLASFPGVFEPSSPKPTATKSVHKTPKVFLFHLQSPKFRFWLQSAHCQRF